MAVDAPVRARDLAIGGPGSYPRAFVIAPVLVETNQNDHQYEFATEGAADGLVVVVNISANTGAISLVVTVQGVDALGNVYTILASAVLAATGVVALRIGPAVADAANVAKNHPLPAKIRILTTHGNTNSVTYSIAGDLS